MMLLIKYSPIAKRFSGACPWTRFKMKIDLKCRFHFQNQVQRRHLRFLPTFVLYRLASLIRNEPDLSFKKPMLAKCGYMSLSMNQNSLENSSRRTDYGRPDCQTEYCHSMLTVPCIPLLDHNIGNHWWNRRSFLTPCLYISVNNHRDIHTFASSSNVNWTFLMINHQPGFSIVMKRFKQSKKGRKQEESSDDSDDETDEDDDGDNNVEQLSDAPTGYKKMKVHIKSLRADALVSSGLNMARNKVDEMFYKSKLYVNGEQLLKKSKQISEGDYVDLVVTVSEDIMKVKRVQLVKVSQERTRSDKLVVWVRVWKTGFDIDKPNRFIPHNSEQ